MAWEPRLTHPAKPGDDVLRFWFADSLTSRVAASSRSRVWYGSDPDFDAEIRRRFEPTLRRAAAGELEGWKADAHSALALTIVLDQFPRNVYRGTAGAFELDPLALDVCLHSLDAGHVSVLHPTAAVFALLPLEHAEDLAIQRRSLEEFSALRNRAPEPFQQELDAHLEFSREHFEIIERFGRFPHRNAVLGRESTPEELAYLEDGPTFGW